MSTPGNSTTGSTRLKYDEETLKKWLAALDNGEPLMYVDLLSAIGHESPSTLRPWWVSQLTERILEFADYFSTTVDQREGILNRCNNLVLKSEVGREGILIEKQDLRRALAASLGQSMNADVIRENLYNTLRTAITVGQCLMCGRSDTFYPGIWPRNKKQELYKIPFVMRLWFTPSRELHTYIDEVNNRPAPGAAQLRRASPTFDNESVMGICASCPVSCESCGSTMDSVFASSFFRAMVTDRECPKCSRGKLTSLEPPKPNLRELKVYKQRFKDLTK